MIRQQFVVDNGLWKCAGCAAGFLDGGVVEHPASCPQMQPVKCKHELVLESCADCMPKGPRSVQADSQQNWADLHYVADRSARPRFGPWIEASYGGWCGNDTRHRIEVGDRIRADDEIGEFVCEACGSEGGG